jgi:hypothetical protein
VPAGAWGRGYPKPRRPSVLAKVGSGQVCRKGWGSPRAAPSSSTPNARRAASLLCRSVLSAASRLWASRRGGVCYLAMNRPSCREFSDAGAGERGSRPAAPMRAMALASPPAELRVQAFHAAFRAVLSRPSSRGRVFAGDRALESLPAAPQRAKASTAPWRCTRAGPRRRAARRGGCTVSRPSSHACVRA